MLNRFRNGILIAFFAAVLTACASSSVPKGSKSMDAFRGTYEGTATSGISHISLYEHPDGTIVFRGYLLDPVSKASLNFEGTLTGKQLAGTFNTVTGTISGTLSADGSKMSGNYHLTPLKRRGTWQAGRD
jgi:hypothetical protein